MIVLLDLLEPCTKPVALASVAHALHAIIQFSDRHSAHILPFQLMARQPGYHRRILPRLCGLREHARVQEVDQKTFLVFSRLRGGSLRPAAFGALSHQRGRLPSTVVFLFVSCGSSRTSIFGSSEKEICSGY